MLFFESFQSFSGILNLFLQGKKVKKRFGSTRNSSEQVLKFKHVEI